MKPGSLFCFLIFFTSSAAGQQHSPVWESYLPSITITHGKDSELVLDLLYKKEGGPYRHTEHQMYLLGYLRKDEAEILKISRTRSLLDKTKEDNQLFLDVLLEKKLVTIVETQVAKRGAFAGQDTIGKYRDGSDANQGKASLAVNTFPFAFTVKNSKLFDSISELKNFDAKNTVQSDHLYFSDKFKFLVFVPVNDCKYATQISEKLRTEYDFTNYDTDFDTEKELNYRKSPTLLLRPLPYKFQFKRMDDGDYIIYIN